MKKLNYIILLLILTISCNTNQERLNDLDKLYLKGNITSIVIKEFDAIEKFDEIMEDNQTIPESVIKFNENGNILELNNCMLFEKNFYNSLRLHSLGITKYLYDGLILKEKNTYNQNGDLIVKWKYTTDTKGNIIKEISYNKLGTKTHSYVNKYDKLNNLIESIQYNKNSIELNRFKFNPNEIKANENLSKIKHNDGTFEIYKNGVLIQFNNTVNNYTYKYSFDDNNNWVKRIEFENEKPIKITKREIEYI